MNRFLVITGVLALGACGIPSTIAVSPLAAQSAATQVAALRTVSFSIENMTCAIAAASTNAGYPAMAGS